jgi:hypothetical protein
LLVKGRGGFRDVCDQGRGGPRWERRRRHRQGGTELGTPDSRRHGSAGSSWTRSSWPGHIGSTMQLFNVEVAWEARSEAEQAVVDAEAAAAAAIARLLAERVAVKDVVRLTGLDQATVRRLRQVETDTENDDCGAGEGAGVEVA